MKIGGDVIKVGDRYYNGRDFIIADETLYECTRRYEIGRDVKKWTRRYNSIRDVLKMHEML